MKKLFLLLGALTFAAAGQDSKPNFSGKWELQVDKSDFGGIPGPESQITVIDHQEPKLKLQTTAKVAGGERSSQFNYTTDGEECTNDYRGAPAKSRTRWEGRELVTEIQLEADGMKVKLKDRWRISDDGQGWNVDRTLSSDLGEITQKLIFLKK